MEDLPNLRDVFPVNDSNLKIGSDLGNRVHGPHFDVIHGIPGGTDQIRVDQDGSVIGGTTNIGKVKMNWP